MGLVSLFFLISFIIHMSLRSRWSTSIIKFNTPCPFILLNFLLLLLMIISNVWVIDDEFILPLPFILSFLPLLSSFTSIGIYIHLGLDYSGRLGFVFLRRVCEVVLDVGVEINTCQVWNIWRGGLGLICTNLCAQSFFRWSIWIFLGIIVIDTKWICDDRFLVFIQVRSFILFYLMCLSILTCSSLPFSKITMLRLFKE